MLILYVRLFPYRQKITIAHRLSSWICKLLSVQLNKLKKMLKLIFILYTCITCSNQSNSAFITVIYDFNFACYLSEYGEVGIRRHVYIPYVATLPPNGLRFNIDQLGRWCNRLGVGGSEGWMDTIISYMEGCSCLVRLIGITFYTHIFQVGGFVILRFIFLISYVSTDCTVQNVPL